MYPQQWDAYKNLRDGFLKWCTEQLCGFSQATWQKVLCFQKAYNQNIAPPHKSVSDFIQG